MLLIAAAFIGHASGIVKRPIFSDDPLVQMAGNIAGGAYWYIMGGIMILGGL